MVKTKTATWLELSNNDLELAEFILKSDKRFHYVVHFCHQAVKKLLKAIVQELTDEAPLRTHNFRLLCKQAKISISNEKIQWLFDLSPHYLGTRYPEDMFQLYKEYNRELSSKIFRETKEFCEWLRSTYLK